jgi:DNA-binding HxlR family transcriptional regulator
LTQRSYRQACSLARALDAVGERWTLLIVRDLLLGPARFGELLERLPGIGTNLLAQRLKSLERIGIVTRTPRTGARGWGLTARGHALEPMLMELIRWAMHTPLPARGDEIGRPEWDFVAMKALFDPGAAGDLVGSFVLTLNGVTAAMEVSDGRLDVRRDEAPDPMARIEMDTATGWQLATGGSTVNDAVASRRVVIGGDTDAAKRLLGCFRLQ